MKWLHPLIFLVQTFVVDITFVDKITFPDFSVVFVFHFNSVKNCYLHVGLAVSREKINLILVYLYYIILYYIIYITSLFIPKTN